MKTATTPQVLTPLDNALKRGLAMTKSPTPKKDVSNNDKIIRARLATLKNRGGKWKILAAFISGVVLTGAAAGYAYSKTTDSKYQAARLILQKYGTLTSEQLIEVMKIFKRGHWWNGTNPTWPNVKQIHAGTHPIWNAVHNVRSWS